LGEIVAFRARLVFWDSTVFHDCQRICTRWTIYWCVVASYVRSACTGTCTTGSVCGRGGCCFSCENICCFWRTSFGKAPVNCLEGEVCTVSTVFSWSIQHASFVLSEMRPSRHALVAYPYSLLFPSTFLLRFAWCRFVWLSDFTSVRDVVAFVLCWKLLFGCPKFGFG